MYHIDSKSFVLGCTSHLKRRFTEHKRELKSQKEKNTRFQELFTERWEIFKAKMANENISPTRLIGMFFPSYEKYKKYEETAEFLWVVLQSIPRSDPRLAEQEAEDITAELNVYEKTYAERIQEKTGLTSLNYWMEPDTKDREGRAVCIDGVFYINKAQAARKLNLFNKAKANKQLVANRLESRNYPTWCFVESEKLVKRLRRANSSGQRVGYETVQYGEIKYDKNNQPTAIYFSTFKKLNG